MKYQIKAKEETLKNILRDCIRKDEFTSGDIVKSLNLTKPTVNESLDTLYRENFITKENFKEGRVGRKAQIWKTTLNRKRTFAMDIDVDLIKLAVVDMNGDIYFYKEYSKKIDADKFLKLLKDIVSKYREGIPKKYINGIKHLGISIAGNVSFDRKNILYATNLGLNNINITSLEEELGLDIVLENEANSAVLGEFFTSKEYNKNNYLLISISNYGVGGGQIVEGKLQKGAHRLGGEIGHFTIVMDGELCTCGNKGCFERYASYEGLKNIMKKYKMGDLDIEELFKMDDGTSSKVIREYCRFLGIGIRSLLSIYDPNKIILSGKITKYWDKIYPYIRDEIFSNNNFYSDFNVTVTKSRFDDNASLVGVGIINFLSYVYEDYVYK